LGSACPNNVHLKVKDDRIDIIVLDPHKTSHKWFSESPTIQLNYRGQFDVDFTNVGVKTLTNSKNQSWGLSCAGGHGNVWQDEQPKKFADALMRVKLEYDRTTAAAEEIFQKSVVSYRAANPKPELPEEAHKFKVQAEDAVHDKQLDEAADFYGQAIKIAPWWPAGHFNRALVLGELGAVHGATLEMKRYLALVPDAPNARAAQDKIYSWERKLDQPN
jgi:tetratricopeptide (TPR) repeat protein